MDKSEVKISTKTFRNLISSPIEGYFFRIVNKKYENEILSIQGSLEYGGRYNPKNEFGILYLGQTEEVCKAEKERAIKDLHFLKPQLIAKINLKLEKVLDLTNPENLKMLGISEKDLVQKDYDIPQMIGKLAKKTKYEALLVPSITGKGKNLAIFMDNLSKTSIVEIAEIKDWEI